MFKVIKKLEKMAKSHTWFQINKNKYRNIRKKKHENEL